MTTLSGGSPEDLASAKAALRREAIRGRDALSLDERLEWDQAIAGQALQHPILAHVGPASTVAGPVAGTWPIGSEADPRPILEALHAREVGLALPAVEAGEIVFRAWAPDARLVPGGFGTLVPDAASAVVRPRILLVPLLAFDRTGARLGYGRGYYDRAIRALRAEGVLAAIGLAYAAQEVEAVPAGPGDEALDAIVTEREVILVAKPTA